MLRMHRFIPDINYFRCYSNPNVNIKPSGNCLIIIFLDVDDLIVTSGDPILLSHVTSNLKNKFEMTDLGHLHYFLSLQVLQYKERISLS